MKRMLLIFSIGLFSIIVYGQPPTTLTYVGYHRLFEDDFTYGLPPSGIYPIAISDLTTISSSICPACAAAYTAFSNNWTTCIPGYGGTGLFTESQVTLESYGVLKLTEKNVPGGPIIEPVNPCSGSDPATGGPRTIDHYTGGITSKQSADFWGNYGYGIIEASIQISNDGGCPGTTASDSDFANSAFWINSGGPPNFNEIDIIDACEANWLSSRLMDYLYPDYYSTSNHVYSFHFDAGGSGTSTCLPCTCQHLYSCMWTPSYVAYYLDDQLISYTDYSGDHRTAVLPYSLIRTYPNFQSFSIGLNANTANPDGMYMTVSDVKVWRQDCDLSDLDVFSISTTGSSRAFIIGGLYKFEHITSNNTFPAFSGGNIACWEGMLPSGGILPSPSPIIFEAGATTILPNFIADESEGLDWQTVNCNHNWCDHTGCFPPDPEPQIQNTFLLIQPITNCSDDNAGQYSWFRMTGNGNNSNNFFANPVKNNVVNSTLVSVYPNPTQNTVTISYPCISTGQLQVKITDVAGKVLYTESVACTEVGVVQHVVDMSSFTSGVYFADLTMNEQHVVKKLVKL